jgi:hypothetical protein
MQIKYLHQVFLWVYGTVNHCYPSVPFKIDCQHIFFRFCMIVTRRNKQTRQFLQNMFQVITQFYCFMLPTADPFFP